MQMWSSWLVVVELIKMPNCQHMHGDTTVHWEDDNIQCPLCHTQTIRDKYLQIVANLLDFEMKSNDSAIDMIGVISTELRAIKELEESQ